MRLEIADLAKTFDDTAVLEDVNLEIRTGEFLGLLGPSGSGKTTLLRILAGLDLPDRGRVLVDGQDLLSLPLRERKVGFVFQHYALFNHMSVADNVAFGLEVRPRGGRPSRAQIAQRVEELLTLVQLAGMGERFPAQLSGGQRQRVALARTLAVEPRLLLLDEPFGALDAKVRVDLRRWLRALHDSMGLTTVFVTHDQEEALDLADRIAVMHHGRLEQVGTPAEIYERPGTPFIYDFLGRTNAFDCRVEGGLARIGDRMIAAEGVPDGAAIAFVRPHDIVLAEPDSEPVADEPTLPGTATVGFLSALGPRASVELRLGRTLIEAELSRDKVRELDLAVGSRCAVRLRSPHVFRRAEAAEIQTRTRKAKDERIRFLRRRQQVTGT